MRRPGGVSRVGMGGVLATLLSAAPPLVEPAAAQACTDDGFEDNDSQGGASPIGPGPIAGLRSCPGDEDWYELTVGSNLIIETDVFLTDALGDFDLRLYDSGGAAFATSVSGTDDERIEYAVPAAGQYFLRVDLAADDAVPGNDYDLGVVLAAAPPVPALTSWGQAILVVLLGASFLAVRGIGRRSRH